MIKQVVYMTDIFEAENVNDSESSYKKLLTSTISEGYPKYIQDGLLKNMEKGEVLLLRKRKTPRSEDILDLSEVESTIDRLSLAIDREQKAVKHIERNEFYKSYKYAAFFHVNQIKEDLINDLLDKGEINDFVSPSYKHDFSTNILQGVAKPTLFVIGNVFMFKFSKVLSGHVPGSGEKKQIKYPMLGIYFKHMNILEVRLDSASAMFRPSELFYESQIGSVLDWFAKKLQCSFKPVNFPPVIEYIRKNKQPEVVVDAQSMSFQKGGKAILENGINENYVLPLLGELKELMSANKELFDNSPEIKKLLETFVTETETLADLPWITLVWKSDKTKVKFKFGVTDEDYTILQYYGRHSEMEKMDYVTEYIIKNQKELRKIEKANAEQARELTLDDQVV
ncbi:hypothetical protein JNUCC32_13510 [Paenibacillus sp. JNUCC32]|uniref:hypothetical protein n=1 Tax=Paenibacillus sp. JNUCC32 TaxID=2777984 RepID=UPI001787975C|nr:hypothetical protein [Paenibacillus sp. JNUCC-32]QOT12972.1 hypothetical protein JNUCC32_13510 [Paenibacillus sp. JNUCC-32]